MVVLRRLGPQRVSAAVGHVGQSRRVSRPRVVCGATPEGKESSSSFVENMINGLTVAIQSSPLADGKKRMAIAQAGLYDAQAVKARMEQYIAENKVMIFSFSTCPFCKNAKKLLDDMGVGYEAVELNEMDGGMALRAELAKLTGRTSMPNIWIGGKGIGGCNDGPGLMTLYKNGELEGMLKQAGAL
jgi:glutaredoxin 3